MFGVPVVFWLSCFNFVWYKLRYSGLESYLRLVLASIVLVSNLGIFLRAVAAIFFMFFVILGSFGLIFV